MRVVSLVPSWTETLIDAGVEVVGRTRYCIHPEAKVASIPIVGGTKDWDFSKIQGLKPDLLVLDREENPKFMGDQTEIPFLATHITQIEDVGDELGRLAQTLGALRLNELAERWRKIAGVKPLPWNGVDPFPGVLEWGLRPVVPVRHVEYVIWRKPWMGVSRSTFIGSVLNSLGIPVPEHPEKYPVLDLEGMASSSRLLLFSSEPFPFRSVFASLREVGCPYALVDGECFSWFGVRTLRFLERAHGLPTP